jgi:hypothetical protein
VGDKKAGDCSTTWITLDSETRKPKKLENTYDYLEVNTKLKLDYSAQKITIFEPNKKPNRLMSYNWQQEGWPEFEFTPGILEDFQLKFLLGD